MQLTPLVEFDSEISDLQQIGETPFGNRKIYIIGGGHFWGERINGVALPGGGDWVSVNHDGLAKLDVRKTIKTDDGALINMSYQGYYQYDSAITDKLEQGEGYEFGENLFKVQVQFETGDPRYDWLNTTLAVGEAKETGKTIIYRIYEMISDNSTFTKAE
ncbi:MAG TPA: DUF3237 domain-containing protein [Porticoccus sp.]|nr:DUF3237 domain-containing protein [Porticoccus sp.]